MDGVKTWLSKNKTSGKTLPEERSPKSTRLVLTSFLDDDAEPCDSPVVMQQYGYTHSKADKAQDYPRYGETEGVVFHIIRCHLSPSVICLMTAGGREGRLLSNLLKWPVASWRRLLNDTSAAVRRIFSPVHCLSLYYAHCT